MSAGALAENQWRRVFSYADVGALKDGWSCLELAFSWVIFSHPNKTLPAWGWKANAILFWLIEKQPGWGWGVFYPENKQKVNFVLRYLLRWLSGHHQINQSQRVNSRVANLRFFSLTSNSVLFYQLRVSSQQLSVHLLCSVIITPSDSWETVTEASGARSIWLSHLQAEKPFSSLFWHEVSLHSPGDSNVTIAVLASRQLEPQKCSIIPRENVPMEPELLF